MIRMERHLDRKVKLLWLAPNIGLAVVVALILAGLDYAMRFNFGIPDEFAFLTLPIIFIVSFGIICGLSYAWIHLHYVNFTYELAETEVIIRWGIFTRLRKVIPYARIQNINTERTVLERLLGIGSLMIETAGTQLGLAEGIIPGIANPNSLIDEILHRVEKTKKANGASSGLGDESQKSMDYSEILLMIHQELKSLNAKMGEMGARKEAAVAKEQQMPEEAARPGQAEQQAPAPMQQEEEASKGQPDQIEMLKGKEAVEQYRRFRQQLAARQEAPAAQPEPQALPREAARPAARKKPARRGGKPARSRKPAGRRKRKN